jgi:hypothetical protein
MSKMQNVTQAALSALPEDLVCCTAKNPSGAGLVPVRDHL